MQSSLQCWCQTGLQQEPHCPLGPAQDTVCSPTEELKTLITKHEMAIICPKQVTTAIKHDTGCTVRIATEIEQTSEHHWYGVFMIYAPSANGILHLILRPMIVVLLCCIFLLVLLVIYFYTYVYHISPCVERMNHQLLPDLGLSECPNLSLSKAREPTIHLDTVFFRVWSVARGKGDCPLSSDFGPTCSSLHTPTCAGTGIEAQ